MPQIMEKYAARYKASLPLRLPSKAKKAFSMAVDGQVLPGGTSAALNEGVDSGTQF